MERIEDRRSWKETTKWGCHMNVWNMAAIWDKNMKVEETKRYRVYIKYVEWIVVLGRSIHWCSDLYVTRWDQQRLIIDCDRKRR